MVSFILVIAASEMPLMTGFLNVTFHFLSGASVEMITLSTVGMVSGSGVTPDGSGVIAPGVGVT